MRDLRRKLLLLGNHFFWCLKTADSSNACGMSTLKSPLLRAFSVPDVHPRLRKRPPRCTLDCGFKTPESPALRGFVAGLRALATAALYLVIFSNGEIRGENLRNGTWSGGKHLSPKAQFPIVGAGFSGPFHTSPTNAATFVSRGRGGYTRHPAPNRAHSGSQGETGGVFTA